MSILTTTSLEFITMRPEEGGVTSFVFKPTRHFKHLAGQHGLLTIPRAGTKPLSLASAPEDPEVLIGTRLQSHSSYKQALSALRPGQRVSLRGPIMNFTLKGAPQQVVLLAQGVGVTPFRSMLRHCDAAKLDHHSTLIHVADGHVYRAETAPLATASGYPCNRDQFRAAVEKVVAEQQGARYYISGAGRFVSDTAALLAKFGVSRKQIKKASFSGYQDDQVPIVGTPT